MARIRRAKHKLARRERYDIFPRIGDTSQSSKRIERRTAPGEHPMFGRMTQYAVQFREKQKVKRMYGVLEKQFRRFFGLASKRQGETGLALLQLLELRLDNVVYRSGFAKTRDQARQIVNHGHVTVNGKKLDIPSSILKIGDEIEVKDSITSLAWYEELKKIGESYLPPIWIGRMSDKKAKVEKLPAREDIDPGISEKYLVEFYSK